MQVLLDVGAGIGYYSLAASARGHRSIATELSPISTASFEASIQYNGFDGAITLHKACPRIITYMQESAPRGVAPAHRPSRPSQMPS